MTPKVLVGRETSRGNFLRMTKRLNNVSKEISREEALIALQTETQKVIEQGESQG